MARYCFYCGRELNTGEKCNCRSTSSDSRTSEKSQATPGSGSGSGPGANPAAGARTKEPVKKESIFKRIINAINPFASGNSNRPVAAPKAKRPRPVKARPAAQPRQPVTLQSVLKGLQQFGAYITRPADSVRSSLHKANRRFVMIILLLQGICGGLFLLVTASRPTVRALLSLSNATASGSINFANGLFLFVQGFGMAIVATLLLALLYNLTFKYLYRHPVSFRDLLAVLSPAALYFTVFLMAALLTLSSSVFSALMLIVAGFAVAAIAQYLAVREIGGTDDNRSFVLVTFVMLIYTSVLSLVLNLSLPMLLALLDSTVVF